MGNQDVVILNIGMFDKDTKQQELSDDEFVNIISEYFDCTITKCVGVYTHDDGTKVIEPSLKVEIYNKDYTAVYWDIRKLCRQLNQESIVLSRAKLLDVKFVNNEE